VDRPHPEGRLRVYDLPPELSDVVAMQRRNGPRWLRDGDLDEQFIKNLGQQTPALAVND